MRFSGAGYAGGALVGLLALSTVRAEGHPTPERAPAVAVGLGFERSVVALRARGIVACSGVLVSPDLVLTARHCLGVNEAVFDLLSAGPSYTVRVTGYDVPPNQGVDAALVLLERDVDIAPSPMRRPGDDAPPQELLLVGFGARRKSVQQRGYVLRARARGWGCDTENASLHGCQPGLELVLPRRGGVDTCQGDSGGPAFELDAGGRWRLAAITSRAVRDSILLCGDGGIYVRADSIAGWVEQVIRARQSRELRSRTSYGGVRSW